jgi:NAD(P)-dependent dehydrogenase (short-subunit alcohol dehydrogenase family)
MTSGKVWFIAGASTGLGRIWASAALARGDRVAAAAADLASLDDLAEDYGDALVPIELEVSDRTAVFAAVDRAIEHFGRIDVVVNDAGYGLLGMVEEVSEEQARAQLDTNLLGALWVTQAALPHLREQRSGHVIQVSAIGGVEALPMIGLYHASKWALEGLSHSLAAEVADLGINVTLVEPTGCAVEWAGPAAAEASPLGDYDQARERATQARSSLRAARPDAVDATVPGILELVDADEPPMRVFATAPADVIDDSYLERMEAWESWEDLSRRARGEVALAA